MTAAIIPSSPEHNYVVVAGVQSPGRAQLTGVAVPYVYDVQQSYGREGAVSIFKGRGLAKFTLTIAMWTAAHFVAWAAFAKLLEPPKISKPLVVEMRHPLLTAADIKQVAVESFGQPERQTNGLWIATIKLIEYRPTKTALVKPRGAIPSPEKGKPITPKTEADIALAKATDDFKTARNAAR